MSEQAITIIAFGKVDADGNKIDGSDNWVSRKDMSNNIPGVYRVDLDDNTVPSPTVILSAGDHKSGEGRGIEQSDNIFVPFDVTHSGFGVNSRDLLGHNAGNQDSAFNFVVLGMK